MASHRNFEGYLSIRCLAPFSGFPYLSRDLSLQTLLIKGVCNRLLFSYRLLTLPSKKSCLNYIFIVNCIY